MQNTTEQNCQRQLAVTVDVNVKDVVVCVVFDFQPCTTCGHSCGVVNWLAVFVLQDVYVYTRRTYKLGYNYTLCTIDDKTTSFCHQREVAHEYFLIDKFACTFVCQTNCDTKWACVGCITQNAFCLGVLLSGINTMAQKLQTEVTCKVLDWGKVFEYFADTMIQEVLVTGLLHLDEVWQRQNFLCLRKRFSVVITVSNGFDVLWHDKTPQKNFL